MSCEITTTIKGIPLYQHLYGNDIDKFELHKNYHIFPILDKKTIATNFPNNWMTEQLRQAIADNTLEYNASSGTTSERMQIVRKKRWWAEENHRTYQYHPILKSYIDNKEKKAVLTTAICSNTACYLNLPSYEERIIGDTLYLNISPDPNTWTKEDVQRIIAEINQYQPAILDVDPIYLALLLKLKNKFHVNENIYFPKIIKLTYEFVTHYTRQFIENYFKHVPTLVIYGSTETGYNLFEMDDKRFKHVPDRCYMDFEWIDTNLYNIKITSWKNEYMPLINYKINDLARISDENIALFNKRENYPVIVDQLCGRLFDAVKGQNNTLVTVGDVDKALSKLTNTILIYQLKFYTNKLCHFRYVTAHDESITDTSEKEITNVIHTLCGSDVLVQFSHEKSIHPEASGKFAVIKKG